MLNLLFTSLLISLTYPKSIPQELDFYVPRQKNAIELLDRKVEVVVEGPYIEIQYTYTYQNTLNRPVTASLSFPQAETDIYQIVKRKDDHLKDLLLDVYDLINSPLKKYDLENEATGERFTYKKVEVGDIRSRGILQILFTVMKPLKIMLNQFYELNLHALHIPEASNKTLTQWNIQLQIRTDQKFIILNNPSHNLKPELFNHTADSPSGMIHIAFYNVTVSTADNFRVFFASSAFSSPQGILATRPFYSHDHVFMLNIVPDMNYTSSHHIQELLQSSEDGNGLLKVRKTALESELRHFPNEYLFVLDRSNSMKGSYIEQVKKALIKLLDILFNNASYFRILSFGSSFELHANEVGGDSAYKLPENTRDVMRYVEALEANMGEKDLLSALKFALEEYGWTQLPRNVIILTDWEVPNMDEILQLVQGNLNSSKICAVGIEGLSSENIQKIGEAGRCKSEFVSPSKDFEEEAVNILEATLPSPEFNLVYEVTCQNEENRTVYQEEAEHKGIPKNKAIRRWISLEKFPHLKSCKAKIFYSSQERCSSFWEETEIFRPKKVQVIDGVWHKVTRHAKLHEDKESLKFVASFPGQFRSPFAPLEISQEESNSRISLYTIYKEQFSSISCQDSKFRHTVLSGVDEKQRREQDDERNFFSFEIICTASVVTLLLFVAGIFVICK